MAKKRDRLDGDGRWHLEPEEAYGGDPGALTPTDERVASFANAELNDDTLYPGDRNDIDAWDDLDTAPDLFAEASGEDQMTASGETVNGGEEMSEWPGHSEHFRRR